MAFRLCPIQRRQLTLILAVYSWDDGMPFFVADFSESEELAAACPRTLFEKG